jgi:hypothetical protein
MSGPLFKSENGNGGGQFLTVMTQNTFSALFMAVRLP